MTKTVGIVLIAGGILVGIIIAWLGSVYLREESLSTGAAALGIALGLLVFVLPQIGFGIFLWVKGSQTESDLAQVKDQRRLLSIIKTKGQMNLDDLVVEMQSTKQSVKEMIYHLVGMGLYSGYINWDEGVLYSAEANQLRKMGYCAHCNGELQLAGKGISQCPYCGTDYFLE
jgi:hypothetical protein